jgi:hypothetical protein
VQSQDYAGAKWAVGQRVKGAGDDAVEQAFHDGRILRTHVLRPTWHFVVPEDIRWMLALTAPRIRAAMGYYDRQLKLTEALFRRANQALARALGGGRFLTRAELGEVLARAGIEASGQRLAHLVMRAELDAVVCSGPRRGKQFTYALLDERAAPANPLDRDEALGALATRYFSSHGPALPLDFAWWSGFTLSDAHRGVQLAGGQLAPVTIGDRTYWQGAAARAAARRAPHQDRNAVHLLPNYDEYLIAYKERSAATDLSLLPASPGARREVFANHLIIVGGRLVGGWRRLTEQKTVIVETRLLAKLSATERQALQDAASRLAAFLNQPVQVRAADGTGAGAGGAAPLSRRSP